MRSGFVKVHLNSLHGENPDFALEKAVSGLPEDAKKEILQNKKIKKHLYTSKNPTDITILVVSPEKGHLKPITKSC